MALVIPASIILQMQLHCKCGNKKTDQAKENFMVCIKVHSTEWGCSSPEGGERKVCKRHRSSGSPSENGYVESFNGTLRDDLLNREIFLSCEAACLVIDRRRLDYNHHRIHSSLDY